MRGLTWNIGILSAVVLLAGGIPLACSGTGDSGSSGSGAANGAGGGTSSGNGMGGDIFATGGGGPGQMLKVEPPVATIDVVDGVSGPVDFEALLGDAPVGANWTVDISGIAGVDGQGLVKATGTQGGEIKVKATYNGLIGEATVIVNLKKTMNPNGIGPTEQGILENGSEADAAIQWTYPYDKTVFPKGLLPPELMWNNGGADDTYLISYKGKYIDFKVFSKAAPPSRSMLDEQSWKELTESGKGGPVNLVVKRLQPGAPTASVVVNHTWTIANGSLRGTVYYWANSLGRVLRIKPGSAAPDDFLLAGGQGGCSTCHSVSANGSTLIIGGDIAPSTWDLLSNTAVLNLSNVGKSPRNWAMPAISPNGKVLVENNAPLPGPPGGSDGMFDAFTGMKLANTGLEGVFLDMPAFAPNGTKLAYVDHSTHNLGVMDYDANVVMASKPTELVPMGADGNWNCIAFPSVSPDAKWIVYHRGVYPSSLDTRFGPGALYLASIDQPGVEMRLSNLNGDTYPFAAGDRDRNFHYEPTFAPLNSGGYAWVVFTSRRTYGNRLTAGSGSVKQLWVAAIDQNAVPGQDPSHPAFWVPGQDMGTLNMRGFWALDPCKQTGAACGTGSECCNQNCEQGVCKDPDENGCSMDGNFCDETHPCCTAGSLCINNICSETPPQ